jgi:hypothetical protein
MPTTLSRHKELLCRGSEKDARQLGGLQARTVPGSDATFATEGNLDAQDQEHLRAPQAAGADCCQV